MSTSATQPLPASAPDPQRTDLVGHRSGPSMATVVWGLVLVTVAVLAVLGDLGEWDLDPTLVLPAILLGAGLLLVASATVAVLRGRQRPD